MRYLRRSGNSSLGEIDPDDIAIIGLSCRFPGDASTPESFWDLLCRGRSTQSKIPKSRFNVDAFYNPTKGRTNTTITEGGHFIAQDVAAFDAAFFNINQSEAGAIDPQQRMMMEVTYEALENAGLPIKEIAGTQTGCFVGSFTNDYREMLFRDAETAPRYTGTGAGSELLSNRLSWFYDLRGPSMTLGTACSSSLVAVHQACQSLRTGESKIAIAGGVNIMLNPDMFMMLSNQQFLSPDGLCKSFDERGDGYSRGEGIAAIILKPISDAIRDGDTVRAVIRGTGVNQDGKTKGITVPNAEAQAELIRATYVSAGLPFSDTYYFEAHGTGTRAGDPSESRAIAETLGAVRRQGDKLFVGSVKSNIGHLEACAGLAGLIKGVYILESGVIPKNIHYKTGNSQIPFEEWRIKVPTTLTAWPVSGLRRLSVNSFGYGGTNAHAILDDAYHYLAERGLKGHHNTIDEPSISLFRVPRTTKDPALSGKKLIIKPNGIQVSGSPRLFVFSTHDEDGLSRLRTTFSTHFQERLCALQGDKSNEDSYLQDLAFTLSTRRTALPWKMSLVASSTEELAQGLYEKYEAISCRSTREPRLGFVFTGQGAQWAGMGIELCNYDVFRRSLEDADEYLSFTLGCKWSVIEEMSRGESDSNINLPEYSQTLCTVLQVALVDLLASWNISPAAVVGHSSGEIAAAYCLGALTKETAWKIAYFRGTLSSQLKTIAPELRGTMLAAGCSEAQAWDLISKVTVGEVVVACVNSPSSVTISGDASGIEEIDALLKKEGIFSRKLKVETAYHSPHMSMIATQYLQAIMDIETQAVPSGRKMHSSVTGSLIDPSELGPANWVRNLLSPVLFSDAVHDLLRPLQDGEKRTTETAVDILVEIGPYSALQGPVNQVMKKHSITGVNYRSVLSRKQDAVRTTLTCVGALVAHGASVDVNRANNDTTDPFSKSGRILTDLPTYSWNHSRTYWGESRLAGHYRFRDHPHQTLIGAPCPAMAENERSWRGFLRLSEEPWMNDHRIQSSVLYPAAGFIAMAIEGACQMADTSRVIRDFKLRDIQITAAVVLTEEIDVECILQVKPHLIGTRDASGSIWLEFSVSSCTDGVSMRKNCCGLLLIEYEPPSNSGLALEKYLEDQASRDLYHLVEGSCQIWEDPVEFYASLSSLGLVYGPTFQNMTQISEGKGQSCCVVSIPDTGSTIVSGSSGRPHIIHPTTLDAMFHASFAALKGEKNQIVTAMVPKSIDEVIISANIPFEIGTQFKGFSNASKHGFNEIMADIQMLQGQSNSPAVKIKGFCCVEISGMSSPTDEDSEGKSKKLCTQIVWKPAIELLSGDQIRELLHATGSNTIDVTSNLLAENYFVDLVAHTTPDLSILEIGIGSADMASSILSLGNSNLFHYTISDADATKLERLQTQLQPKYPAVEYKVLDIERDLVKQQFKDNTFDIIIISHPLYTMQSLEKAFMNSRKLLKSGGKLCLIEVTSPSLRLGSFVAADFDDSKYQKLSLITASAKVPSNVATDRNEIIILENSNSSEASQIFASQLVFELETLSVKATRLKLTTNISSLKSKKCIALLELETSYLEQMSAQDFSSMQQVILQVSSILWVTGHDTPAKALIVGLARSVRNEIASLEFHTLELSSSWSKNPDPMAALTARLATTAVTDDEFVEEDGILKISRAVEDATLNEKVSGLPDADKIDLTTLSQATGPQKLTIQNPGMLDSLCFEDDALATIDLLEDEVEIEVKATGLNFRDIMVAMDQIPDKLLGFEASGVITRVGKGVKQFQVGDAVCTLGHGAHRAFFRNKAMFCQYIPEGISFEEAATLPLIHCTAYHALVRIARVEAGQSILIHAAAGGVGQAAIQLAKHFGMEIFATVGSQEKGALIKDAYGIQEDHIFNSRDLSFQKGVMRMTKGRGVDCVLNSLSGEALRQSWYCVAPFGTFVEIGLKDILGNTGLDMRPFLQDATFVSLNLEHVTRRNPKVMAQIIQGTFDFLRQGVTKPVAPLTVYPVSEIENAFRIMQTGKHIGKIAISFGSRDVVPVLRKTSSTLELDGEATYVLVGGLGGLGRSLSNLLVHHGARNLCFISRSGADSAKAKKQIQDLESAGIQTKAYCCDIADASSLAETLRRHSNELPAIKGVIQCAMVLRDGLFENQSYQGWIDSTRPKVQGTWNLHSLLPANLDFFIVLSSFAGVFGNRGQSNYAAAGAYQDALAHFRRTKGLKSVTIDLGIMQDVGVVAELGATGILQEWEKSFGIREFEFHALLKAVLIDQLKRNPQLPLQIVTGLATGGSAKAAGIRPPFYFEDARFSVLSKIGLQIQDEALATDGTAVPIETQIAQVESIEEAANVVTSAMVAKVAKSLQTVQSEIDESRPLHSYGVDSLVAIEIRNWIFKVIKAEITVFDILSAVPINVLANRIATKSKLLPERLA
ncbi:putative polyketide synthase, partial [Stipitochalara longipes BDJ]